MSGPLRPLTLGETLDRTLHLYRSNFSVFIGVATGPAAVYVVVFVGLQALYRTEKAAGSGAQPTLPPMILLAQIALIGLVSAFNHAALTNVAVHAHLDNRVTIRQSIARGFSRYGRILWLTILQALLSLGIPSIAALSLFIPLILYSISHSNKSTNLFIGLAAVLLVVAAAIGALWLLARYAFGVAACLVEEIKARAALKRAVALSKGARGRIFAASLLLFLIAVVLMLFRLSVVAIVRSVEKSHGHLLAGGPLLATQVFEILFSFAAQALLSPLIPTAFVVLYYDQRVRQEGYDIERMMEKAGLWTPSVIE